MARTRMVTRTITTVVATAICMEVTSSQVETVSLNLPTGTSDTDALKVARKLYETDTYKVVSITETTTVEELYGMLETDFIASAMKLDPETRKALELDTEEE